MSFYADQTGRAVEIRSTEKIVSLVPSQTELLFDLGLDQQITAITKFCVHPQHWLKTKSVIGGTKNVNIEKIKLLQPTLIIANKEENVKEQIAELEQHFPVWISDVHDLDSALKMIASIGTITGTMAAAQKILEQIKDGFTQLNNQHFRLPKKNSAPPTKPKTQNLKHLQPGPKLKTAYLIWKDPCMTVGGDTFISNMLHHAGLHNIFENETRYPQVTIEQLSIANCQLLLLSSEPYPFKQKHIDELQQQLPNTKILLVDGEMFSWYGSRLIKAPLYFAQLKQKIDSLF
jgi:ABC-type Fe3+-hydroxamate transport system substrate-binding protein